MGETFCGKICETCEWKERQQCPGCQAGPGNVISGDCDIAGCCREKQHQTCQTCTSWPECMKLASKQDMPQVRQNLMDARAARQVELARQAPVLGKWLWLLFWLVVPTEIGTLMSHERIVEWLPWLRIPGEILTTLCAVAYGAILLRLGKEYRGYRTAGICALTATAVNLVCSFIPMEESLSLAVVLLIPVLIVSFVGEYYEYQTHSEMLVGLDDVLAGKWKTLWMWYIGSFLGMFGGLLLMIIPIIGALAVLACAIAFVVTVICKWVYLYRMAKQFREAIPREALEVSE